MTDEKTNRQDDPEISDEEVHASMEGYLAERRGRWITAREWRSTFEEHRGQLQAEKRAQLRNELGE